MTFNSFFSNYYLQIFSIFLAIIIDLIIGDPKKLLHPVVVIGLLISFLTKRLNKKNNRKLKGLITWVIVILITFFVYSLILYVSFKLSAYLFYFIYIWFLATSLASKSLFQACFKAATEVENNNIKLARKYTGEIVGRDTSKLNKNELLRAIIETEAESGVDGIISPLFYMFLGIPLSHLSPLLNPLTLTYIYKAVNTMDSMIGYKNKRFQEFGFIAAKMDDFFNFLPARIGSYLYLIASFLLGYPVKRAFKIYQRDKANHTSPNAGHPEAMVAGLMRIKLGGINIYFGKEVVKPELGESVNPVNPVMIKKIRTIILLAEFLMFFIGSLICYLITLI